MRRRVGSALAPAPAQQSTRTPRRTHAASSATCGGEGAPSGRGAAPGTERGAGGQKARKRARHGGGHQGACCLCLCVDVVDAIQHNIRTPTQKLLLRRLLARHAPAVAPRARSAARRCAAGEGSPSQTSLDLSGSLSGSPPRSPESARTPRGSHRVVHGDARLHPGFRHDGPEVARQHRRLRQPHILAHRHRVAVQ